MSIKRINMRDLLDYEGKEGLILTGCGGEPQEWLDGINELFTQGDMLLEGTKFTEDDLAVFDNEGSTCILFEFNDNTKLNIGKLAMWRIGTHATFGGTWLTDFVDHQFGGFHPKEQSEKVKPDCPLIGQDGNIFNLMGIASRTLRENGMRDEAKEMTSRITTEAQNYHQALGIISEYVNITSMDEKDGFSDEDLDDDLEEGSEMTYG